MAERMFPGSNGSMTTTTILGGATLLGATLATAMVTGLLFCFAHSVMPGLRTLDDRGFLVWSTVPASINPCIGDRVQFTSTIVQSDDDPMLAYASRPTKASILTGAEPVQQLLAIA